MDKVAEPPTTAEAEVVSATDIGDAVALFNRALEESEHDEAAAQELFEESFDGMMELALAGDTDAQHNVALMYEKGIGEPYDEDISVFLDWTIEAEEDRQAFLDRIDAQIQDILAERNNDSYSEASRDPDGSVDTDHDAEARKLRRLYLLKTRLEKQGFKTGANRDDYHEEHDNE